MWDCWRKSHKRHKIFSIYGNLCYYLVLYFLGILSMKRSIFALRPTISGTHNRAVLRVNQLILVLYLKFQIERYQQVGIQEQMDKQLNFADLKMSVLEKLMKLQEDRDMKQRRTSSEGRIRFLEQTPQDKKEQPTIKNLFSEGIIRIAGPTMGKSKQLEGLFCILKRKVQLTLYYCFVKLEAIKKTKTKANPQVCQSMGNNQKSFPLEIQDLSQSLLIETALPQRNFQQNPEKLSRAGSILKRLELGLKIRSFQKITTYATKRAQYQLFPIKIERILNAKYHQRIDAALQSIKTHSNQIYTTQILSRLSELTIKQRNISVYREAMDAIRDLTEQIIYEQSVIHNEPLQDEIEIPFTNQTLTFSNLIETGDEEMDSKRSEAKPSHRKTLSMESVEMSPIIRKFMHLAPTTTMKPSRPLQLQPPKPTSSSIKVQWKPQQLILPKKQQKMPKILHRIHQDQLIKSMNDQADSISLWIDSTICSELPSFTKNESSFVNYLQQVESKQFARQSRPSILQNILKPPLLTKQNGSSNSAKTSMAYGFDDVKRDSLVDFFRKSKITCVQEDLDSPVLEKFTPNPEERGRRGNIFNGMRISDRLATQQVSPVHALLTDRPLAEQLPPLKSAESSPYKNLFEQSKNSSRNSIKASTANPKKSSDFYMQYLRSIRRATQTATIKTVGDHSFDRNFSSEENSSFRGSNTETQASHT